MYGVFFSLPPRLTLLHFLPFSFIPSLSSSFPPSQLPAFDARLRYPTRIASTFLPSYIDWLRLSSVVTLSCGPALSLPCGLTHDGRPVGLQIIGQEGREGGREGGSEGEKRKSGAVYK